MNDKKKNDGNDANKVAAGVAVLVADGTVIAMIGGGGSDAGVAASVQAVIDKLQNDGVTYEVELLDASERLTEADARIAALMDDLVASENVIDDMRARVDGDEGFAGLDDLPELNLTQRAKIINAMLSLPAGYTLHSNDAAARAIAWVETHDAAAFDAAVEVVGAIARSDPGKIGGSAWIPVADIRMKTVLGHTAMGAGHAGMTPEQLGRKVAADRDDHQRKLSEMAAAQSAAEQSEGVRAGSDIRNAFKPDVGGSGVVRTEDVEDLSEDA